MKGAYYTTLLSVMLLILVTNFNVSWNVDGGDPPSFPPEMGPCASRGIVLDEPQGSVWYDELFDSDELVELNDTIIAYGRVELGRVVYKEDFEDYYGGQDIFGSNNWTLHTVNNEGTFLCDSSHPHNSLTPKVAVHYNDDMSTYSSALSDTFLSYAGTYDLWAITSRIDPVHTTTSMNLINDTSDSPVASERLLDVAFTQGGFGCRGSTGNWNMLSTSVSANTWYRVSVDFNCSSELCNVFLYDRSGAMLGSILKIGFQFSQNSARRLILTTAPHPQGLTSYWDDIRLIDRPTSGYVVSREIVMPEGKLWSTLSIDKEEPGSSRVELSILNGTGQPISGFDYNSSSREVDLSGLNGLRVRSIVLKAELNGSGLDLPALTGWGVEWNTSGTWSDMFLTSLKTGAMANTKIEGFSASLVNHDLMGSLESVPIDLPSGYIWNYLYVDSEYQHPSSISVDILDGSTRAPIGGFTGITSKMADISMLNRTRHPSIILRGVLMNDTDSSVSLRSWAVDWMVMDPPEILYVDGPARISNISSGHFEIDIAYPERFLPQLDISVHALFHGNMEWSTELVRGPEMNISSGSWEFDIVPNSTDVLGLYSIRVKVVDVLGNDVLKVFFDLFEIYNVNDPPVIIGLPPVVCDEDELYFFNLLVTDPDPEDSHQWYLDTEADFLSIDGGNLSGIPGNEDIGTYPVTVTVSDHGNLKDEIAFNLTVMNVNDHPVILTDLPDHFTEDEPIFIELEGTDIDPTKDNLLWEMRTNSSFLSLRRLDGVLTGLPDNDDVGEYFIVIDLTDGKGGSDEVNHTFTVLNVNDRPELVNPPLFVDLFEDTIHNVNIFPSWFRDVDGDILEFQYTVPVNMVLSMGDNFTLLIDPLKDYCGQETVTIMASDGSSYVDWTFTVRVIQVNDAPYGARIYNEKERYLKGDDILLTGSAEDVDLDYGDKLTFRWYAYDGTLLGTGPLIKLDLGVGEHRILLKATDEEGAGNQTSVFINVYEEEDLFDVHLVLFLAAILVLILTGVGIGIFLLIRRSREKEKGIEGLYKAPGEEMPSLGSAGDIFSASLLGGRTEPRMELSPIMKPVESLSPAGASAYHMDGMGQHPLDSLPAAGRTNPVEYLRPGGEGGIYRAVPPPQQVPTNRGADNFVQLIPQEEPIEAVKGEVSPQEDAPLDPGGGTAMSPEPVLDDMDQGTGPIYHEDHTSTWSPEMVDRRLKSDAVTAVELVHELNRLRAEGAITEEEFQVHKKRLLRKI